MIQLNNIYKYIDKRFQRTFILKDVNLQIKEGEFITIMGPSGAGKSTLLNILGFLDLSLIHISEPTRLGMISYAVFCLKKN